jgi:hypothetical protein
MVWIVPVDGMVGRKPFDFARQQRRAGEWKLLLFHGSAMPVAIKADSVFKTESAYSNQ